MVFLGLWGRGRNRKKKVPHYSILRGKKGKGYDVFGKGKRKRSGVGGGEGEKLSSTQKKRAGEGRKKGGKKPTQVRWGERKKKVPEGGKKTNRGEKKKSESYFGGREGVSSMIRERYSAQG